MSIIMADWLALSAAIAASSNKALHLTAVPLALHNGK